MTARPTDQLAGLRHTALVSRRQDAAARAVAQQALLHRVGTHLPLLVIADVCRALTEQEAGGRRPPSPLRSWQAWSTYVERLQASHAARLTRRLRLPPEAAAGLALHLLEPILDRWPESRRPARLQMAIDPATANRPAQLSDPGVAELEAFFALVEGDAFRLQTRLERMDLDTLRLLAMVESNALAALDAETLARWLYLLEQPEVHDVVNFALELLPSVLDEGPEVVTHDLALDGYDGIERNGSLADLSLTELAYDEDIFMQRYLERELFFNARAQTRDREPEHHLVLVDGTASMRGLRAAFARGLALSLVQRNLRHRRTVEVAFFDSGLHPPVRVGGNDRGTTALLGFEAPRGRDYPRAFAEVARYLDHLRRETRAKLVLTFVTHARCALGNDLVSDLLDLAEVRGVFLLPGDGQLPSYAPLLSQASVVDESGLGQSRSRLQAARGVLEESA